jgi:hypothetical protein
MALSRALAASLCVAALLAAACGVRPSAGAADASSPQLTEEIRHDLDDLPQELPPLQVALTSTASRAHTFEAPPSERAGLGPRIGHQRLLLRPPRG